MLSYENIALQPVSMEIGFLHAGCTRKIILNFFIKGVDNFCVYLYNRRAFLPDVQYGRSVGTYGGVAQLARAFGSYPTGHRFESHRRYHFRPLGQEVKTSPFHGGDTGSIPVGVTT